MKNILACLLTIFMVSTSAVAQPEHSKVLVIGDSMLAIHSETGKSVAGYLEKYLKAPVSDRSTLGARMIYKLPVSAALGKSIPAQYQDQNWDWVVVNGGGNDLWLGCGCMACRRKLEKLISVSGTRGEIPELFSRIQKAKARVLYVGYLRSPGIITPIEHCKFVGDELERRVADLARKVPGIHYLSLQDLVPSGDLSYLASDRIHPSTKASREIAERVAQVILSSR